MTKGYVCVECGSQIIGHSKADCADGRAAMLFEIWWDEEGRYLDPDTEDVSWFDKRKELAGLAYMAGLRRHTRTNALIEAAEITASAIRNLEGQPIQYSLARDLSAALAVLELTLKRMGSSK